MEAQSEQTHLQVYGDTLEITTPKGLTLWNNRRITGDYEITYRIKMVMQGGSYDRLSDLNCFWGANDPENPDNLYADGTWRDGFFKRYKTLRLFYVGYGGNDNSTTRFRRYYGGGPEKPDSIVRPIIKEYTDPGHLLEANHWYTVCIRVEKGTTTYYIDGKELFRLPIKPGDCNGQFGLRLLQNHVVFTGFRIKSL
nr:DUF6250 domain-containing protein [Bacteroides gallinarum]